MNTTDTAQDTAIKIIERHYDKAWRMELSTRWQASRGRYTKAKEHDHNLAEAKANAIREIIADLRDAGYTIMEGTA